VAVKKAASFSYSLGYYATRTAALPFRFIYHWIAYLYHRFRGMKRSYTYSREIIELKSLEPSSELLELMPISAPGSEIIHYSQLIHEGYRRELFHLTVIPSNDASLERIRQVTCRPGEKSQCWSCASQICTVRCSPLYSTQRHLAYLFQGCATVREILDADITAHIEECEPLCSNCFFWQRGWHKNERFKRFNRAKDREGYSLLVDTASSECSHHSSLSKRLPRHTCSMCAAEEISEVKMRRRHKELDELRHSKSISCWLCDRPTSKTPWYVCSMCGSACHSTVHSLSVF
jgi:hypothetical protein